MEINYSRLRNLYRLEKQSRTRLTPLEPDFYRLLREYIEGEKKEVDLAWQEQDIQRLVLFANLVKLVNDIIAIRQRKIVSLALASMFDEAWEPENLVGWEKDLYRDVVETVRKYRDSALVFVGLKEEEGKKEEEEKRLKTVRVKILKAIPEFIGTDYKTYGPYAAGEIAELPQEIADILLVRNLAEVVGDEDNTHA
ncbi:MAG: replication factor [Candidatus Diapherotrites archaeon]|nr:replication factor [Candidatus Diapherotrites archaeon]